MKPFIAEPKRVSAACPATPPTRRPMAAPAGIPSTARGPVEPPIAPPTMPPTSVPIILRKTLFFLSPLFFFALFLPVGLIPFLFL